MSTRAVLRSLALVPILALAACQTVQPIAEPLAIRQFDPRIAAFYSEMPDGDFVIPAINPEIIAERNIRQMVPFRTNEPVGTVVVDPYGHHLYLVMEGGQAMRYGIGVGRAGFAFAGTATVARKAAWPRWTPTQNMLRREPDRYGQYAGGVQGGLSNPLGARALYLYRNGRDTLYRIHGTNEPHTIGTSVSAGCIRMFNQDVVDLEQRVPNGSRVVVLSEAYEPASLEIASFGQAPAQGPIEVF